MTAYRKLAEGDDPFSALPDEQLFDALAIVKAMARQQVPTPGFPVAIDEFYDGIESLRRQVVSNQQAVAWSDWCKTFGPSREAEGVMRKAFIGGWNAALGEGTEPGGLR